MSKIHENAISSIRLGTEDYFSEDLARTVSAIRNLYAGLLLLFKEQLRRLSPKDSNEVLVKKNIQPKTLRGQLHFVGEGRATVSVVDIRERFSNLGISVDWSAFERVRSERNNLEHYYTTTSPEAIRRIIVDLFLLMQNFIKNVLEEEPPSYVGTETWSKLIGIKAIHDKERAECDEQLSTIENKSIREMILNLSCDECGSDLLHSASVCLDEIDIELTCNSCSHTFGYKEAAEKYVTKKYEYQNYRAMKETGERETYCCPSCGQASYSASKDRCLICGYRREYEHCWRCGETLSIEEQVLEGLCSGCSSEWERTEKE